jgi:hypothetical protein
MKEIEDKLIVKENQKLGKEIGERLIFKGNTALGKEIGMEENDGGFYACETFVEMNLITANVWSPDGMKPVYIKNIYSKEGKDWILKKYNNINKKEYDELINKIK